MILNKTAKISLINKLSASVRPSVTELNRTKMRRRTNFIILILLTLVSCSRTETVNNESKDIGTKITTAKPDTLEDTKSYQSKINSFIEANLTEYDTTIYLNKVARDGRILNTTNFIWTKTLEFKKKEPYTDKTGKVFYKRFYLIAYEYNDTNSCNKAFDLWLSGFGTEAVSIKRNEFIKAFHSSPINVLVTPKQITAIFMPCEYIENDWKKIKTNLADNIMNKHNQVEILNCGCGGPITWETNTSR